MKRHILGCGDAFGSGGRLQSSYLVEANDRLFLLDCGPTALLTMNRAGFDPRRLDAIIISHLHGDHFGGVPCFLIDYLYRQPKIDPLLIAGPPGTETKVRDLFNLWHGDRDLVYSQRRVSLLGGSIARAELPPGDRFW